MAPPPPHPIGAFGASILAPSAFPFLFIYDSNTALLLRDCWADVDEIRHVCSIGLATQPLGSGILNFGSCAGRGHPELARWRELTDPERGADVRN